MTKQELQDNTGAEQNWAGKGGLQREKVGVKYVVWHSLKAS